MKPFQESMRFEYDLKSDSVVLDCGFYKGHFSRAIREKHPSVRIVAFEPIHDFFTEACFIGIELNVELFNFGLGASSRTEVFKVKGDMSGLFCDGAEDRCAIVDIDELEKHYDIQDVGLFKINCEGGEFEILEAVLNRNMAACYQNIQVQPHAVVPDAEKRWAAIQAGLLKTHHLTFDAPWCWQNYELNV